MPRMPSRILPDDGSFADSRGRWVGDGAVHDPGCAAVVDTAD